MCTALARRPFGGSLIPKLVRVVASSGERAEASYQLGTLAFDFIVDGVASQLCLPLTWSSRAVLAGVAGCLQADRKGKRPHRRWNLGPEIHRIVVSAQSVC